MRLRHPGRWIGGSVALLAGAAAAAPYFGAEGFAAGIQQELERKLGRKVEFHGESNFRVLPRPGFTIGDVVIHEDPAAGVEQFAYVPLLHVDVSASVLWRWRVEIGALRLENPSINLMKAADGGWNVQSLAARARSTSGPLPEIEVIGGRINFKLGDVKSIYHLAETDLNVEAGSEQRLSLRFSGVPARTDRPAHGFGRLSGRGSIEIPENGPGRIELSLGLERTAAGEILTLLQGRGTRLGGFVRSQARLSGGWSNIGITGRMELDEFERWDWLFPGGSGWGLDYTGVLDLDGQTLEVETKAKASGPLPLSVRLRATRLAADTNWGALITLRAVPLDSLRSLAEETGSELPAGLPLQGELTGAVGYSPSGGLNGKVAVAQASIALPGMPPLRLEDLTIVARGAEMSLGPATVQLGDSHRARLEARFQAASPAMEVRLASSGIELSHLQAGWSRFTGSPLPPLLQAARGGTVKGVLHFQRGPDDAPPAWTGDLEMAGSELAVSGFDRAVQIEKAALKLKGAATTLTISEGSLGTGLPFSAVYSQSGDRRQPQLNIVLPELSAADLARSLGPALRRNQGFLARTLRLGAPETPEWLRSRRATAAIRIGSFELGGFTLRNVSTRAEWDGARVDFRDFTASVESAPATGSFTAILSGADPVWSGNVKLSNYQWRDGLIDIEAAMESTGLGELFLSALRLEGSFHGENLAMSSEAAWRTATGCFSYQASGSPRLKLSALHVVIGGESFLGHSVAGSDARQLTIELASAARTLRLPARMNGLTMDLPGSR